MKILLPVSFFSVSFNRTLYPFSLLLSLSLTYSLSLSYTFPLAVLLLYILITFAGTLCALNGNIGLTLKDGPEPYLVGTTISYRTMSGLFRLGLVGDHLFLSH